MTTTSRTNPQKNRAKPIVDTAEPSAAAPLLALARLLARQAAREAGAGAGLAGADTALLHATEEDPHDA